MIMVWSSSIQMAAALECREAELNQMYIFVNLWGGNRLALAKQTPVSERSATTNSQTEFADFQSIHGLYLELCVTKQTATKSEREGDMPNEITNAFYVCD